MTARIYQPAPTAMQSGQKDNLWVLEFAPETAPFIDPLMGWTGMIDTVSGEVRLKFKTKEAAIAYADKNNIKYSVVDKKATKEIKPKLYAANFAFNRVS